jgi:hypothetical protein
MVRLQDARIILAIGSGDLSNLQSARHAEAHNPDDQYIR